MVVTEGIAEDICKRKSAKKKVIQGGLELKERQASNLIIDTLDLVQSSKPGCRLGLVTD